MRYFKKQLNIIKLVIYSKQKIFITEILIAEPNNFYSLHYLGILNYPLKHYNLSNLYFMKL